LVSDRVGMLNPNDKSDTIWGPAEIKAKMGVPPNQILDYLALIGDSVDNIPGVPGVGPTTAINLLNQFGSIDSIYARVDDVKSDRLRNALRESEPIVRKNLNLIRLNDCVDGGLNLKGCLLRAADERRLIELYRRWGFKTMLQELEARQEAQPCLL
jgi:DNA polymerase I